MFCSLEIPCFAHILRDKNKKFLWKRTSHCVDGDKGGGGDVGYDSGGEDD